MENEAFVNNNLSALSLALSLKIDNAIAQTGLRSNNAAAALVSIMNHPGDSIDTLRRALDLTHSGAVRLIDYLVADRLIVRKANPLDARSVVLQVTSRGAKCAKDILNVRATVSSEVLSCLTDEQQTALSPILETMLGALTRDQESARRICKLCNEEVCRPQGCPVEGAILASKIQPATG